MDEISKHKASNLWLGFALGMTASGVLAYFIGTKKGRERLKKLIEFAEKANVDEYFENIVDKFGEKAKKSTNGINSGLDNLIDKIDSFSTKRS